MNNEYTVLFHKGAFELGCEVCPVAIKYNKRLLDPYWNTREQSFTQHILYLMTRWFMIADVWWLPPQRKAPGESSIDFANRVKAMISEAAGLKNLSWDGYLKNYVRQHDHEKLRKGTQAKYVHSLRVKLPQLLGDEYVKTQTDHLIDSDDDKVIRRRRASCSFIDVEPSRVTQLKNEVLVSSPIEICRPTSGGEVKESSFLEHLSYEKDSLVRSWKQFSLMAQLDSSKDASRNEDRLDYSGWRLWSKHRKETKAKTTQETIGILEELSTSSEALDALRS